ncbi:MULTISPECIES: putative hemolysin [Methylobacterium]|uniref:putative hemolysin n=1 Tax=Methylobacterium TaxID=407 RepID=UPI0011CC2BA3|nr:MULTISPECIES: DUF333 domain-containing protein [Methylobacterium]TXN44899.1 DUF333 domain-containing protein [Methylobacterium sp. WL7]TXN67762.1 DUF333 domain-containing protein [Methylobacterium sp. WL18]GJE23096.1 hypothetical protein JHFBIEKO_3557 [Methylobacterium mesophilicum]
MIAQSLLAAAGVCLVAGTSQAGSASIRVALANPASVNCATQGGTPQIRNGVGGQIGYCRFSDGRICEEWALFRDNLCKPPA